MAQHTRSDMELWDRPFQTQLLIVLFFNILAHYENVPVWVIPVSLTALTWKLGHLYLGWSLPKRWLIYIAGAAAVAGVIAEFKTAIGHEAATPILVFLASLKVLETNRDRDALFVILTSYFLLMAHLLHSQSLASTFFMAFDVAIITILMFQLHRSDRRLSTRSLRPVVRLLLLTIPIWAALFVIFPRFNLQLGQSQRTVSSTGFSEGLDPSSIASLVQSDEVAFRVSVKSMRPRSPESMYWRGAVLYDGTDMRWYPPSDTEARGAMRPVELSTDERKSVPIEYEVILEPTGGRGLFTLSRLSGFAPSNRASILRPNMNADELIRTSFPINERIQYRAWAVPEDEGPSDTLKLWLRERALTVKATNRDRLKQLALEIASDAKDVRHAPSAIGKLDEWFLANEFRYTLTPGEKSSASLEDFLFDKRTGYCEHYAVASATLLRLMGHPTRVVVGYQGGRWNQLSKAYIVRGKDAHAWTEVWFPSPRDANKGRWLTYDPTAYIAPLRLRMGGDYLDLPESERRSSTTLEEALAHLSGNFILRAIDRAQVFWDYAQMSWTQLLLDYDQSGQREFLNHVLSYFGLSATPIIMVVLIGIGLAVALRLLFLSRRQVGGNRVQFEWRRLESELSRLGLHTQVADGPLTLTSRIEKRAQIDPENSPAYAKVNDGLAALIELQYGPQRPSSAEQSSAMNQALQRLRRARIAARRLDGP